MRINLLSGLIAMPKTLEISLGIIVATLLVSASHGQDYRYSHLPPGTIIGVDLMDTRNFTLMDYQRMFVNGVTPAAHELQGTWRGVNKGVVTLVGFKQFVKEIEPCGEVLFGDNIQVHQVSHQCLRAMGWQPKIDSTGNVERRGKFAVLPNNKNRLSQGLEFSYRDGGNPRFDASRLLVDKVVRIDNNHMLGRASARFGLVRIPIAFFVLERIK